MRPCAHRIVVALSFTLLAIPARATVVPAGLNPGDPYQLVFVTQGIRDATSTLISDYNQFVQGEAALNPSLTGTNDGVQWFAIASTTFVDARSNAVVGTSVPVYRLDGTTKVADGFADFWDGTLDAAILADQFLNTSLSNAEVFTGSDTAGFGAVNGQLGSGSGFTRHGERHHSSSAWVVGGTIASGELRPLYALSEVLYVVPEPGTGMLAAFGLAMLGLRRRR